MTPAEEAKKLNEELVRLYRDMGPFFSPQPADTPRVWSQAEVDHYFGLYERVGKIVASPQRVETVMALQESRRISMKATKWMIAVVTLVLCLPRNSVGFQEKPNDGSTSIFSRSGTAENLVNECKAVENVDLATSTAPAKDVNKVSICLGVVAGILDFERIWFAAANVAAGKPAAHFCVPDSVSATQAAKVVVKYGNDHPAELNLPAVMIVISAMKEAFPCR